MILDTNPLNHVTIMKPFRFLTFHGSVSYKITTNLNHTITFPLKHMQLPTTKHIINNTDLEKNGLNEFTCNSCNASMWAQPK